MVPISQTQLLWQKLFFLQKNIDNMSLFVNIEPAKRNNYCRLHRLCVAICQSLHFGPFTSPYLLLASYITLDSICQYYPFEGQGHKVCHNPSHYHSAVEFLLLFFDKLVGSNIFIGQIHRFLDSFLTRFGFFCIKYPLQNPSFH